MINELSKQIHQNAIEKGFYEGKKNIAEMLMLIITEVAEACEADRKENHSDLSSFEFSMQDYTAEDSPTSFQHEFQRLIKNTFEDELADIMIRVMDLAGYMKIDLEKQIELKMKYNSLREHKHGKSY
jgi:NTP pyrophosphatase (non-canonical NTP hydrolase)